MVIETFYDRTETLIRLTDERKEHFVRRLENAGLLGEIGVTLANPDIVIQSRSDPHAELVYRRYERSRIGDKWLCVVIKKFPDDAFVLTAYPTDGV